MSRALLPGAHLALTAVFLLWNIIIGGRVARQGGVPRALAALSALGGLLVAPAFLVAVASTSMLTGRTLQPVAWIWPVVTALIALQALHAIATGRVARLVGIPILAYDAVVAATALARALLAEGDAGPPALVALLASATSAQATIASPEAAIAALHTPVPLLAPAHPPRWRTVAWWRGAVAAFTAGWTALTIARIPEARRALRGYERLAAAELRPRPGEPFAVGVEILPPLGGVPQPVAIRSDLALIGEAGVGAVLVTIDPSTVTNLALDSVRRVLDPLRRDSLLLVAAIRLPRAPLTETAIPQRSPLVRGDAPGARERAAREAQAAEIEADSAHIAVVDRVARRLRPDYILPLDDPRGAASLPAGPFAGSRLERLLVAAASTARRAAPRTRIALAVVPATGPDSALYAWAASRGAPVDVVGFTLLAGAGGASVLDEQLAAADRWMGATGADKEHWVFRAGGLPGIHGDDSQAHAMAGILGWAMARRGFRGAIATHAGDYGTERGLRAASGRLRPAFAVVRRAAREVGRQ